MRFQNISRAAVVISNEESVFTQVGFENAVAVNTPVFAQFRESGKTVPGRGANYLVKSFAHGLIVPALGQMGHYETRIDAVASSAKPKWNRAIRQLPATKDWVSVKTLGAKGDGRLAMTWRDGDVDCSPAPFLRAVDFCPARSTR